VLKWRYAGIWREVTILENLSGRSLTILENLWKGLYWILKTSLSPKDQRELFVPFSKVLCGYLLSLLEVYELILLAISLHCM